MPVLLLPHWSLSLYVRCVCVCVCVCLCVCITALGWAGLGWAGLTVPPVALLAVQ